MANGLDALLWDVDGTLAETEGDGHRVAFNRAFAEAGLPWRWDPATYQHLLAVSGGRERLAAFLGRAEGAPPAAERLEALAHSKQNHYEQLVGEGRLPLRPGVARLIGEAATAGIEQAIVTTSSRRAVAALADAVLGELGGAFAFWICGEDVTIKKPDPEAYRLALGRLGLPGERVLVLEDSAAGLAAATAAGLSCVVTLSSLSRQESPAAFAAARAVVEDLGDGTTPVRVLQGPACAEGRVTLSYLQQLLPPP
jgi:HAD superfamily hydrolase (TIGR01509 family)